MYYLVEQIVAGFYSEPSESTPNSRNPFIKGQFLVANAEQLRTRLLGFSHLFVRVRGAE